MVAPSVTRVAYRWLHRVPAVEAPPWLLSLVRVRPPEPRQVQRLHAPGPNGATRRERYARAALEGQAGAVANAAEGTRNHALFRAWARCSRDLADLLPREVVVDTLTAAALAAGLPAPEIARTLR